MDSAEDAVGRPEAGQELTPFQLVRVYRRQKALIFSACKPDYCPYERVSEAFRAELRDNDDRHSQMFSYGPVMPLDAIAERRSDLLWILLCGGTGMIVSRVPYIGRSDVSEIRRSPFFPRAALFALSLSLIPILGSRWFRTTHPLFIAILVACVVSTNWWLRVAVVYQANLEYQRSQRIEEFISSPSLRIPGRIAGLEGAPTWFQTWKWVNTAVFLALLTLVLFWLVDPPPA